ncbi:MAG: hypothetical protein ACM31C_23370 [Acidobacteriota bacterium]
MKRLALVMLVACACPSKQPAGPGSAGSAVTAASPTTCADVRPKLEALYRADAQQREPKRVDEAVADNTQMVMNDCAKDTARIVPCVAKASTVAELEKQCLIPLDEEGTEGDQR